MDKSVWDDQLEFEKEFFKNHNLDIDDLSIEEKIKWTKEFILHVSKELNDLLDCLPRWKMHYSHNDKDLIKSNLKEEYIDVLKYLMGLGQVLGIKYEDIISVYWAKSEVVKQKYEQDLKILALRNKEVVVFDIDGVINYYPDCYLNWVAVTHGQTFVSMEEMKEELNIETYEKYKEEYRLSGVKVDQQINHNTVDTMLKLKALRENIVLYTTRPVSKYKRIYSDTLKWLNKNRVPFDAIYWSDYQKEDVYKLGFKIKYIVEDDVTNARFLAKEGYLVYLLDNNYNQGVELPYAVSRVDNVSEILEIQI